MPLELPRIELGCGADSHDASFHHSITPLLRYSITLLGSRCEIFLMR